MAKKLIGNQTGSEPEYIYYKGTTIKKAVLVHILGEGDCPSCWQDQENCFTDGIYVYKRL